MKKSNFAIFFSLMVLIALLISSCSDDPVNNDEKPTIKIGVLLPETGSGASTGESMKLALEYLKNHYLTTMVNYLFYLDFEYYNTETNPEKCLTGIKYFNSKNIKIIIGPYSSAELEAIADYVKANNMIVMSPSSVAISLANHNDNIFRFAPNDSAQASAVHKYLETKGIQYLTGIYRNDVWGKDLTQHITQNRFFDGNFTNNFYGYKTNLTDLNSNVDMLRENVKLYKDLSKDMKQLAIYFATFGEGTEIIEKIVESSISANQDLRLIGSSAFANNSSLLTKEKAANYAISANLVCPVFAIPKENEANPLFTYLTTQLGRTPESYAIVAYDIAALLYGIIRETNYYENKNLNNILSNIEKYAKESTGISGEMELNSNGDRKYGNYAFLGVRKSGSTYQWFTKAIYDYKTGKIIEY